MKRLTSAACFITVLTFAGRAHAQNPESFDQTLAVLTADALKVRPELAQARAESKAANERVSQVQALPDPMLQVGVQNDGFDRWSVGKMETSFVLFMASQTFPFPGKLALRGELASAEVAQRESTVERLRMSTVADVRRAYLALQLARARVALLGRLHGLLEQSVAIAQTRYESSEGPQSDVLRARLELARLSLRRRTLEADAHNQLSALNRLRQAPLDSPVESVRSFSQLSFPPVPDEEAAIAQARARSPELAGAHSGVLRADRGKALAGRSYFPDISVAAGVMVRGPLLPMWTVTIGVPLPVYAGSKQARAEAEAAALAEGAGGGLQTIEQLIALRTHQRMETWRALRDLWQTYTDGLLVDANATAESTLTQYRVGKVPFAAVLEADVSTIGEFDASLQVLADAWGLAIAQDEVALIEPSGSATAMGGPSVPGSSVGMTSGPRSAPSANSASEPALPGTAATGM